MFFKNVWKNNDIINVNFCECSLFSQNEIDEALYINDEVFVFYDCDVSDFLISMWWNGETMFVISLYSPLMKKFKTIDDWNVFLILQQSDYFCL